MIPENGVSQCVGGEGALPGELKKMETFSTVLVIAGVYCRGKVWLDNNSKLCLEPMRVVRRAVIPRILCCWRGASALWFPEDTTGRAR